MGDTASVEAIREIEALVAFEGRGAGTDAERRAARHLADRLRELGREAEIEPIAVWPNYALTHLIHAVLAVVGSLISVELPLVGILLVALAAVSAVGDMTGTVFLVRRLTGRRASQNVLSREDGDKPGVLVLVAHYDSARGGAIFGRRAIERRATLARRLRVPVGLGGAFVLAILAVFLCTLVRGLGSESLLLSVVQFVPTTFLILGMPLLADIQFSRAVPGAADNASGAATVLRLAERHQGRLEHLDLWVLFTGAEEAMSLGMREWLRARRGELSRERTIFLNLDKVANGTVRYAIKEGLVVAAAHDPDLVALCEEIASEDEAGRFAARPVIARVTSDALTARSAGYRAITISCLGALDYQPNHHQPTDTPDRVDLDALERAFGFSSELIERVDARLGAGLDREAEGEPDE